MGLCMLKIISTYKENIMRNMFTILVMVLTLSVAFTEMTAKQHQEIAIQKLELGLIEDALYNFSQAILVSNNNNFKAVMYLQRGNIYNYLREYDYVVMDTTKAIELSSTNRIKILAYQHRIEAYKELDQYNLIPNDCTEIIAIAEVNSLDRSRAFYDRGYAYYRSREYNKAIAAFTILIELTDNKQLKSISYYYRGGSYNGLGDYNKAISDYDKGLELTIDNLWIKSINESLAIAKERKPKKDTCISNSGNWNSLYAKCDLN